MSTELRVRYGREEQILQIADKDVIVFPEGLVGFGEWRRFVLLEDPKEAPVGVLQCIDDTEVSFLVTDPLHVCADYRLQLPREDLKRLGLGREQDGRVLCILSAEDGPVLVKANLLGPIVVNPRARLARQVVLQDSGYSAQYPVLTAQGGEVKGDGQGCDSPRLGN